MRIINTYRDPVPPEKVLTEAEIIALCCKKVPVNDCSEVGLVGPYEGADEKHRNFNEKEALAAARANNPKARIIGVHIEGIGPPPGTPCGELHETWEGHKNCCEGVPALAWDDEATPDVLPHGRSIIIAWTGSDGREVTVTTSSNGTYFSDERKTAEGHGNSIELFAGPSFCGSTAVTVSDGCSTATHMIRSDLGQWLYVGEGCVIPGATGNYVTNDGFGQRVIEAISGNIKQLDYQVQRNSYNYGSVGYYGGIFSSVYPNFPLVCPEFGYSVCNTDVDVNDRHCQCGSAAGYPLTNAPTCLAPNTDGLTLGHMCSTGSWLVRLGTLSLHCVAPGGQVVDGGIPGYAIGWLGAGTPPKYYQWSC